MSGDMTLGKFLFSPNHIWRSEKALQVEIFGVDNVALADDVNVQLERCLLALDHPLLHFDDELGMERWYICRLAFVRLQLPLTGTLLGSNESLPLRRAMVLAARSFCSVGASV
jgi:hypothetical protein